MTTIYEPSLAHQFTELLVVRERELLALLNISAHPSDDPATMSHEVTDFKDVAAEQMIATVNEAGSAQAEDELAKVMAARRRLNEGNFGRCLDCGKAISLQRLFALPAAAYCTACQATREHNLLQPGRH